MAMMDAGFGKDRVMCGSNGAGGFRGLAMLRLTVFLDQIQVSIGGPDETAAKRGSLPPRHHLRRQR